MYPDYLFFYKNHRWLRILAKVLDHQTISLFFNSRSARICCSNDSSPPLVSVPQWYHMQMYFNFFFLGYEECKETMDGSILFWKKPKTKGCIWWPSWPCENQDQCLDSRSLYPNKFSPSCFLWLIWLIPIFATGKSLFFVKFLQHHFMQELP